ncbi:hypothetical protein [Isoptericola croceus]|uniref:hypothetical protein n=1 Tax=Isoptericola croceus TaxID=3031406 RepID=UPI0023F96A85|nr:hypothetical protein [Isoptericola croceus]
MPMTCRPRAAYGALCVLLALGVTATGGCTPGPGAGTPVQAEAEQPAGAPAGEATPLPSFDPATAVGGYAPGFPTDLLAAPESSTVLASSATPTAGDLVEVSLNLSTELSTQEIVDRYAERLGEAGFEESETLDASALTVQTAYTRTKGKRKPRVETVLIGVLDDAERRLVSLSGSVVADEA